MTELYSAVILGIIEGLTEFLPVSSSGHLIIAGHLLDYTGPKAAVFEVFIQLGAILAVVLLYLNRFLGLLKNTPEIPFSGIRGLWMLFLTSLPAGLLGLLLSGFIKTYLFNPVTVSFALAIGAVFILVVEKYAPSHSVEKATFHTLDEMTPKLAFGIGCFQCLALWPGFSRSAATIMGGMLLGARRTLAAEYSFLAAVPIMFAATGYDMLKHYHLFSTADLPFFAVGFIVSFISALVAVKTFISLVGKMTFKPFAWYRLIIAPLVYLFWT
ncbi:undecaprenyl-diphosphate phosphatase [Halodesulfovibrio sp.]|jgi:undecaprenyl-diphosphatase|uniref:undecaprenyl-diphosphate phosphatase n=1 Tax=Halodesulfovibrio sp. TaxID=1912772 RepID=UPI0025CC1474|nr:undecaprenyl-diphosphate phosphatase [Halodesulfovibrio sp.]MCT4533874.1 undecaprenyl-diphosphate phosphatase [Halodesulfovibrio sp.]MCT4628106.1 undecaprenyl-diphosphate phosphatase [Halodesulfovibrio sp.]